MIPRDYVTAWRGNAPWVEDAQVEQDLVISQRAWLAALLALRREPAEQYRWYRTLRRSGCNNRRQFRHLRRLRFVIGCDPPAVGDAHVHAGAGPRKKTCRRKRRIRYRKLFEEDAVEEKGKVRPLESLHFQIGDGTNRYTVDISRDVQ